MLALTQRMTERNATLQSENSALSAQVSPDSVLVSLTLLALITLFVISYIL